MPPNPQNLKPFVKGDKRINRDGRPATAASLSALAKRIGHEVATKKNGEVLTGPDGKPVTVIETILRQWAQNPKQQGDFVDRAYGKVPQQQQLTGADGGPIRTITEVVIGGTQAPGQQATGDILDEPSA
jgi:hypothetical protein